ncbi:MAG: response regulator [Prolixibacteraceae bacterium]|jgi:signal transduction histidine kinase/ligand-binding sensor domain-containing protein/DNA-binding response OmpR family regulator|nr:response regulator [Prolixibacteraceae bacterium]
MKAISILKHLLLYILLVIVQYTYSQSEIIKFNHLTVDDGLSQSHVSCIFQDSKGFLWFGTQNGLNKYNGYEFITYQNNPHDTSSISGNWIMKIIEDSTGIIWISTYLNGLSSYDRSTNKFKQYKHNSTDPKSILFDQTRGVDFDAEKNLWISTTKGISLYNRLENNFSNYNNDFIFGKDKGEVIFKVSPYSKNEIILCAETDSLYLFNTKENSVQEVAYKLDNLSEPSLNVFKKITKDSENNYWVYAPSHGIYQLNSKLEFVDYYSSSSNKYQISNNNIRDIEEVSNGYLWVGTDGGGVNIIDKNKQNVTVLTHDPDNKKSISGNAVYDILKDNTGIIWLGHYNDGISYYDKNFEKFTSFYHNPTDNKSISDRPVLSVFEDSKGRIWVGTDGGGLNLFNKENGTFEHFTKEKNNLSSNIITAIHEDSKGNLILGSWQGGLMFLNLQNNDVKIYNTETPGKSHISSDNPWCLQEDKNGNLWMGVLGSGLDLFIPTNEEFIDYGYASNNPNRIDHDNTMTILEDSQNNIWFGTEGGGVYKYLIDDDKMIQFKNDPNNPNSLVNNVVNTLFEDSKGLIWMGTQGNGISIYNPKNNTYKLINKESGLPSNVIQGIVEDKNHTFWISTTNGISHFNKKENTFKNYNREDGLQGNEFKYNASILSSDGTIYMGGMKGLTIFNPDSINNNKVLPPVYFTGFNLFDKPLEIGTENSPLQNHIEVTDTITLSHKQSEFSISYVALNYTSSNKNEYAYKMIGYDKDYRYVGNKRVASYMNLAPGTYTFHVKASNNDNIWNEKGAKLTFIILTPWWQTWWFRSLIIIGIMGASLSFSYWRIELLKEQKRILERKVQERTNEANEANEQKLRFFTSMSHEFRTPLTLILGPIEHLVAKYKDDNESSYYYSVIQKNAFRLLRLINNILDLRKIDTNHMKINCITYDVVFFIRNLINAFNESAYKQNVNIDFVTNKESFETWIDPGKMEIIFYNLISNALHFTPALGTITIKLEINSKNKNMLFVCEDTGQGIEPQKLNRIFDRFYQAEQNDTHNNKGTGIGLSLIKEIIEILGGTIEVSSKLNSGTKFEFNIPILFSSSQNKNHQIVFSNEVYSEPLFDLVSQYIDEPGTIILEKENKNQAVINNNKRRLLIVEDDSDLRNYVQSCLKTYYQVYEASNGDEGLKLAKEIQPSIIISDIMMPIMNGIEFCRQLKEDITTSHIPVVLLSAQTSVELRLEGFETGADAFIPKPFSEKYLVTRVNAIVKMREKLRMSFLSKNSLEPQEITVTSVDEKFIDKAKEIIEKNIDNPDFGVNEMVLELGISRSLVYTKFKQLTNCTTSEFIKRMRLKRACQLLEQKKLRVSEIADIVGFRDPQYFSKIFKEYYGVAPSQYTMKSH